ncbi:proton pump-interactor BIP103-like [Corylus avellana]|uniref:proton pump-interactor BIP103-like n=1 Tax=Corylus avellana TaxID=13451 RepID=UPI00286BC735|nr:proton pump-interactor BIP103-like [Corylus avellana]
MEEQNQEPLRINVVEEGHANTMKVHRFYFVKLWSSNLEVRIEEAKNLMEKMRQEQLEISRNIKERKADQDRLVSRLNYRDNNNGFGNSVDWGGKHLNFHKLTLEKLCFANNAYRGRASKSCSSKRVLDINGEFDDDLLQQALDKLYSEKQSYRGRSRNSCSSLQDLDKNKLHFRMLHGRNTLSEEKKLLKDINARNQKAPSSCFSLDELDDAIWGFHRRERWDWMFNNKDGDQERIIKEKNQLTCLKEKAIATAAVKGKLWTSLGSKQAIQDKIKLLVTELDGEMKETSSRRTILQLIKRRDQRELKKIREDIKSLQKQLEVARHRKNEMFECILQRSKLLDEESSCNYQYRSLLQNARKLAQKKDVATLEELSQEQVEKFFSQWNNNKAFREEYEKRLGMHGLTAAD